MSVAAIRRRQWDKFAWAGLLCVAPTALLSARLVWEQTALSVQDGPQMVGFSLAHSVFAVFLFFAPLAGALWAVTAIVIVIRTRSWRQPVRLGLLGTYSVLVLLMLVPYGYWQRLLVTTHAHGPYAGEYVSYAAATGDLATVKAFLAEGVPVDVRNEHDGATPLHGAAVEGQTAVIKYLLSKGANVNALNAYGDSPVQNAISMNHPEAVALLEAHGGKDIRGSDQQRDRAIHEEVERDIQRMEQHR
jgi:hypothetical protein